MPPSAALLSLRKEAQEVLDLPSCIPDDPDEESLPEGLFARPDVGPEPTVTEPPLSERMEALALGAGEAEECAALLGEGADAGAFRDLRTFLDSSL